ncbi:MAG: FGGY-family carbohydrate kinase [Chloroflexota bacterium]
MLSAAGSLQWYRDTIAPNVEFDELLKEVESIPAGSEGLQFLPYLSGERTPHPDHLARGAFIGLTLRHGRGHMTRALLEGVSFGLKDSFTLIQNAGLGAITQVRASGGGTKGALWRQILAAVLEAELVTVNTTEGAAYGAALLAGVGAGVWTDVVAACNACIKITGSTQPDPSQGDTFRDLLSQSFQQTLIKRHRALQRFHAQFFCNDAFHLLVLTYQPRAVTKRGVDA